MIMKRFHINWTAKALLRHMETGGVNFDCAIQRGHAWDIMRQSLLMHSMMQNYPIPAFYFAQNDEKKYDGLDGKQRSEALRSFVNNEWALCDIDQCGFTVHDETGTVANVSGYHYKDLPKWAQDNIADYSLLIYYMEDLTECQYQEMFFRLNNGKPFTQIELTRVKAQSLVQFQKLASHDMIHLAVTEAGRAKYNHENLIMQAWAVLFGMKQDEALSFEVKTFRPFIEKAIVDDVQIDFMENIFDIIYNIYLGCDLKDKQQKKIANKLKVRTHFICLVNAISIALGEGYSIDNITTWTKEFFDGKKGVSIDGAYNDAAGSRATGTATRKKINLRLNAMVANMHNFMLKAGQTTPPPLEGLDKPEAPGNSIVKDGAKEGEDGTAA